MKSRSNANIKGIDVSKWQGTIDFNKVKAAGIQFVYIKATEGQSVLDPFAKKNYSAAKKAGLKVGFYHYAHADNDPIKEVAWLLGNVAQMPSDLPFVLDIEVSKSLSKSKIVDFAKRWLSLVENKTGKKPMIYTYTSFAISSLSKELSNYPVWIAHYGVDKPGENGIWSDWACFQHSQEGKVPGIAGSVDLNEMDADFYNSLFVKEIIKEAEAVLEVVKPLENTNAQKRAIDLLSAKGIVSKDFKVTSPEQAMILSTMYQLVKLLDGKGLI